MNALPSWLHHPAVCLAGLVAIAAHLGRIFWSLSKAQAHATRHLNETLRQVTHSSTATLNFQAELAQQAEQDYRRRLAQQAETIREQGESLAEAEARIDEATRRLVLLQTSTDLCRRLHEYLDGRLVEEHDARVARVRAAFLSSRRYSREQFEELVALGAEEASEPSGALRRMADEFGRAYGFDTGLMINREIANTIPTAFYEIAMANPDAGFRA